MRIFAAVVLLLATTFAIGAANDANATPLWLTVASWIASAAILIATVAAAMRTRRPWLWRTVATLAALYCLACLVLVIFRVGEPLGLDAGFFTASPSDSAKTLVKIVGWTGALLLVLSLAGVVALYAASLTAVARPAAERKRVLWSAAVLVPLLAWTGLPHVHLRIESKDKGELIEPAVAALPPSPLTRGESVFLLQLESVNGLIGSDEYAVDGKVMARDPMVGMRRLAKHGVFFPSFWGNSILTHRAQETILCGVVRNVHDAHFDPRTQFGDCLPELLHRAGYKTVFLSSYPDREFGATGRFMARAGFRDVRFADSLMKTGDRRWMWGYDENAFYRRAFEYLRRTYRPDDKLFVYMAVCAHHPGFARTKEDWRYFVVGPEEKIRQYLWSQEIQDRSLLTFDRLLRDYSHGEAHAFYVPDHSAPLGLYGAVAPGTGATLDNFITTMLYVPPDARAREFAVGESMHELHAQTDLIPTVIELLSDRPQPNSLVPFMKRNRRAHDDYEQCHVMTQPFGGRRLLVVRGADAYQYHAAQQKLRIYRIHRNPLRQELVREIDGLTYDEFERRYGCPRYRQDAPVKSVRRDARNERTP